MMIERLPELVLALPDATVRLLPDSDGRVLWLEVTDADPEPATWSITPNGEVFDVG